MSRPLPPSPEPRGPNPFVETGGGWAERVQAVAIVFIATAIGAIGGLLLAGVGR
jgi:hypothetical protein